MVCIKDIELNLRVLSEGLKKDYKESEIEISLLHLTETGKSVIIDLYAATRYIENSGLYEKWKVVGLEIEIAKFMHTLQTTHLIDNEATEEDDAFIAMLRGVYTMCCRYVELKLAVEGKVIINDKIIDYKDKAPKESKKELPEELKTDEAKQWLSKTIERGFMTDGYQWTKGTTRYQIALWVDIASDKMGIKHKWKWAQDIWGLKDLAQTRNESKDRFGKVEREKDIEACFE